MSFYTYGEFKTALFQEADIADELFIQPTELVRIFNKSIQEAESLIHLLHEDYFLTFETLPLVTSTAIYDMPADVYAHKIRGIIYNNGSKRYLVKRVRNLYKFEEIEAIESYVADDFYKYIVFSPSHKRLTVTHDNANPSVLTLTGHGLYENERVQVEAISGGTLPAALSASTDYFAKSVAATTFQLSATRGGTGLQLATGSSLIVTNSGPKIRLSPTAQETSTTNIKVWYIRNAKRVSTTASDFERDATVIDIPEFSNFILSYAKMKVYQKEGNAMYPEAKAQMEEDKRTMVNTLQQMVPDNDDTVEQDLSHYEESN